MLPVEVSAKPVRVKGDQVSSSRAALNMFCPLHRAFGAVGLVDNLFCLGYLRK